MIMNMEKYGRGQKNKAFTTTNNKPGKKITYFSIALNSNGESLILFFFLNRCA